MSVVLNLDTSRQTTSPVDIDFGAADTSIKPAAGSIVISGSVPLVAAPVIAPASGGLTIIGSTPVIAEPAIIPGADGLEIIGSTPIVYDESIIPSSGGLLFTGQVPVVDGQLLDIQPASGVVAITGSVPLVAAPVIAPASGGLTIVGNIPTVQGVIQTARKPNNTTPLSDLLTLRTTAVWGEFDDIEVIPHRIGITAGSLIAYNNRRFVWVWADHACAGVDSVAVDGLPVNNWQWRNGVDSSGSPVCFVEFDNPIEQGVRPVAFGRGKLLDSGALMDNPADVLWYIRSVIAGQAFAISQVDQFRFECSSNDVTVAGSINDSSLSIQGQIRQVIDSVGGLWSAQMPGMAKLVAGFDFASVVVTAGKFERLSSRCDHSDLINRLTIDYLYVDGAATQSITLEAPQSVLEYGRRATTLAAPWVGSARVAEQVGRRYLNIKARPQWVIDVSGVAGYVSLGDGVDIDHVHSPVSGEFMVSGVQADISAGISDITVSAPAGDVPVVEITHTSSQTVPEPYAAASVTTQGNQRVLTLTDNNRQPLAGAVMLLNGQYQRTADAAGRVTFPASIMPPGEHVLLATSGGQSIEWTVVV